MDEIDLHVMAVDEAYLDTRTVDEVDLALVAAVDEVDLVARSWTRSTSARQHGSDGEVDLVLVAVGEVNLFQGFGNEVDFVHGRDDGAVSSTTTTTRLVDLVTQPKVDLVVMTLRLTFRCTICGRL